MLSNEKWDVFTLPGLVAWLRTQDPNEKYSYHRAQECLIYRYLKDKGVAVSGVYPNEILLRGRYQSYPKDMDRVANYPIGPVSTVMSLVLTACNLVKQERTYGAALTYAEKLIAKRAVLA